MKEENATSLTLLLLETIPIKSLLWKGIWSDTVLCYVKVVVCNIVFCFALVVTYVWLYFARHSALACACGTYISITCEPFFVSRCPIILIMFLLSWKEKKKLTWNSIAYRNKDKEYQKQATGNGRLIWTSLWNSNEHILCNPFVCSRNKLRGRRKYLWEGLKQKIGKRKDSQIAISCSAYALQSDKVKI